MTIQGYAADRSVYISGRILDPAASQKVYLHSPDGFAWGYHGSAPAQLALAILLEMGLGPKKAFELHQEFKIAFLGGLDINGDFVLKTSSVQKWIKERNHYNGVIAC